MNLDLVHLYECGNRKGRAGSCVLEVLVHNTVVVAANLLFAGFVLVSSVKEMKGDQYLLTAW